MNRGALKTEKLCSQTVKAENANIQMTTSEDANVQMGASEDVSTQMEASEDVHVQTMMAEGMSTESICMRSADGKRSGTGMPKVRILCFTDRGAQLAHRICGMMSPCWEITWERCPSGGLRSWTKVHFETTDGLIYIGAAGIAVRAIAPFVCSKLSDPAVLSVDELGGYVIPLLSGHLGGANAMALALAERLGAQAVVTTATDLHGLFAVDVWAKSQGLTILNPERIKSFSAAILKGQRVLCRSEFPIEGEAPAGMTVSVMTASFDACRQSHPTEVTDGEEAPPVETGTKGPADGAAAGESAAEALAVEGDISRDYEAELLITVHRPDLARRDIGQRNIDQRDTDWRDIHPPVLQPAGQEFTPCQREKSAAGEALICVPGIVTLGIGCKRGTSRPQLEARLQLFLDRYQLPEAAICRVATIDLKKDEAGLLDFCQAHGWPLVTYTAGQLMAVPGDFEGSDFVRRTTGADNVCERSAVLAGGSLIAGKMAGEGVTMAAAAAPARLSWQSLF